MDRANYIGAPAFFNLNQACMIVAQAFGHNIYLVGSALTSRDYRDVDVRCIMDDEDYARLFPGHSGNPSLNALWSLMCSSISLWLSQHSGLPVDFQIQQQTEANADKSHGHRCALGMFYEFHRDQKATESSPGEATWEQRAKALWELLDDIDTSDDAMRSNDAAFRSAAREQFKKRHAILASDGYTLSVPKGREPK